MQAFVYVVLVALFAGVNCMHHGIDAESMNICKEEFNVTSRPDWKVDADEMPENFKCFVKCLVTKMGFVTESGGINEQAIIEKYTAPKSGEVSTHIQDTIDKCKKLAVDQSCGSATKVFLCMKADLKEHEHHKH